MKHFLYILTTVGLVFCGNPEKNGQAQETKPVTTKDLTNL